MTHYTNAKLIDKKHQNMLNILNVNLHFFITSVADDLFSETVSNMYVKYVEC